MENGSAGLQEQPERGRKRVLDAANEPRLQEAVEKNYASNVGVAIQARRAFNSYSKMSFIWIMPYWVFIVLFTRQDYPE